MPRIRRNLLALSLLAGLAACTGGGADDTASTPPTTSAPSRPTELPPTTAGPEQPATPAPEEPTPQLTPPDLRHGPGGIADQVTEAERAIRDPDTPDAEVADQGHLQQVAYREVAEHPAWLDRFLDALPEDLRDAALAQVAARQEFLGMTDHLNDGPPTDWRIVAPAPADDLLAFYQEAEDEFGVEWEVLAAVNLVETGMGRIRGVSSAGAQGPMQFLPTTWERWGAGGDIEDPHDAIMAAGRYLGASGAARGDLTAALFEYNNHNNYVRGVLRYAEVMREDPDTFRGFYHWQIYYRTTGGDLLLPEGYPDVPAASRG